MTNPTTGPHLRPGAWASIAVMAGFAAAIVAAVLTRAVA
jgi:hypothetical protein